MKVTRLKFANVRVITAAEFCFQPDFSLSIGTNGGGRTSVTRSVGRLPFCGRQARQWVPV